MLGSTTADPRVRRRLDAAGLKYEITDTGNFRLGYRIDEERTQVVFINSETSNYLNLEIRDVWSVAYKCHGAMSQKIANYLLLQNGLLKIGAWHAQQNDEGETYAIFQAQVSADSDADTLKKILTLVSGAADKMENLLTAGGDRY